MILKVEIKLITSEKEESVSQTADDIEIGDSINTAQKKKNQNLKLQKKVFCHSHKLKLEELYQ